jgi:hypothetical protein
MTLLSVSHFARGAGVSTSAVHRAIRAGTMPGAVKMGRDWFIPSGSLSKWSPPKRGRPRTD